MIYTDEFPPFSLLGACSMSFCGVDGIRTNSGLFLTADLAYSQCGAEKPVKAATVQFELDHFAEEFHELTARARRLSAYGVIQRTGSVTDLQLSYFGQNHPGEGIAYRRGVGPDGLGMLLRAHVSYIPLIKMSSPVTDLIGWTKGERPVQWSDWLLVDNQTWAGPNGWTRRVAGKTTLVTIPNLEMFKRDYDQRILESQDLTELTHPHVEDLGDLSIVSEDEWAPSTYRDFSSTGDLTSWFLNPLKSTLTVLGIVGVLSVTLYIVIKLKRKPRTVSKRQPKLPQEANSWV